MCFEILTPYIVVYYNSSRYTIVPLLSKPMKILYQVGYNIHAIDDKTSLLDSWTLKLRWSWFPSNDISFKII